MLSLHLVLPEPPESPGLPQDVLAALAAAGLDVTRHARLEAVGREGVRVDQVLLCSRVAGAADALQSAAALSGAPPWPLVVLSPALDAAAQQALVDAGVSAWADIDAINEGDLPALLAQAQARWRREAALRLELVQLRTQMDDRKWVDKAKGLLMLARGLGEDDAFALLRRTAMDANLRLGDVSRSVVDAAQWAEAVNRAGQLRMLSQRLARLAAQGLAAVDVARSRSLRRRSSERVAENLVYLERLELADAAAEGLKGTKAAWQSLSDAWTSRVTPEAMVAIDAAAESLLANAEALTASLERASGRRALQVINLCGRQRMLSERLAKAALLSLASPAPPGLAPLANEFEQALLALEQAPLTSPEIRGALATAREEWLRFARGVQAINKPHGGAALVRSAEALVDTFDELAGRYEHSLQVLVS